MGTVNGLESGDFGPDINTQRLILPAGRQWEKDTRGWGGFTKEPSCRGEQGLFCPETKQTRTGEEGTVGAEEVLDLPVTTEIPVEGGSSVLQHSWILKHNKESEVRKHDSELHHVRRPTCALVQLGRGCACGIMLGS